MLPNDVLLDIFDLSLDVTWRTKWHRLVHVCQKWRKIVFSAPRRLNLELICQDEKPVRNTLYVWPPLPIKMFYFGVQKSSSYLNNKFGDDVDNIIAALEHKDRICEMTLFNARSSEMEEMLAAMQEPFPALVNLKLRPKSSFGEAQDVRVADSFLGGSAPRLQLLSLDRIRLPFLGLQVLLSSASGLNRLLLKNVPNSVYFSPDEIVTCLSGLTRLKELEITFQSPRSRPVRESRHPPPPTRILLSDLTKLTFQGVSEYLEDLVAQIDAPPLQTLSITFFHQLFIHTPQLSRFIGRAPRLKGHDEARVVFTHLSARVTLRLPSWSEDSREQEIRVRISCKHPDLQLLSLVQVCTSSFPQTFIPTVKHLYVLENRAYEPAWETDLWDWETNVQNAQWLQLLQPFVAVRDFYISKKFVPLIAPALDELVGERITEALPALDCLFLDGLRVSGPIRDAIRSFVAARQISTHSIAASYWDCDEEDWWEDGWWEGDDD
jgi:F-box-like